MASYEDASEEHEQSCGVGDNNLDIHFLSRDEYGPEQEDDMHNVCD